MRAGSLVEAESLAGRLGGADGEAQAEAMEVDEDEEDAEQDGELEPGEHRPAKRPRSAGSGPDQVHIPHQNCNRLKLLNDCLPPATASSFRQYL